jgi:regulator of cell morphogenesis and NO signaling
MKLLGEQTLVSDITATWPSSIRVLDRTGIGFCRASKRPLADVCNDRRLSFPEIAREIEASAAELQDEDRAWADKPLHAVTDHIVSHYHARLRDDLSGLQQSAACVRKAHTRKAPCLLRRIEAIVKELSLELIDHMTKEEVVLFPAIVAAAAGSDLLAGTPMSAPIAAIEQEHDRADALLCELRTITNGYVPPEWGGDDVSALYGALERIERDVHVHLHLENNVLFPRALRLAS